MKKSVEGLFAFGMMGAAVISIDDDVRGIDEVFKDFIHKKVKITMETIE